MVMWKKHIFENDNVKETHCEKNDIIKTRMNL